MRLGLIGWASRRPRDPDLARFREGGESISRHGPEHHIGEPGLTHRSADEELAWPLEQASPAQRPGLLDDPAGYPCPCMRTHETLAQPEDSPYERHGLHVEVVRQLVHQRCRCAHGQGVALAGIGHRDEGIERNRFHDRFHIMEGRQLQR